jgi:hypothetical protein
MFQKSYLKVFLASSVALLLGACNVRSSDANGDADRVGAENSATPTYTSGTAIRISKVVGPLIFRGDDGNVIQKEDVQKVFDKEVTELSGITAVVETKEGFLELYNGSTLMHALKLADGNVSIAFQKEAFTPETIHYMVTESDAHHLSSSLTFGLKACAPTEAGIRRGQGKKTVAVEHTCQYATVIMELIDSTGSGQGQGSGTGSGTGSGSGQSQGQEKGQDKGQDTTPSKDQSKEQSQDKGTDQSKK